VLVRATRLTIRVAFDCVAIGAKDLIPATRIVPDSIVVFEAAAPASLQFRAPATVFVIDVKGSNVIEPPRDAASTKFQDDFFAESSLTKGALTLRYVAGGN